MNEKVPSPHAGKTVAPASCAAKKAVRTRSAGSDVNVLYVPIGGESSREQVKSTRDSSAEGKGKKSVGPTVAMPLIAVLKKPAKVRIQKSASMSASEARDFLTRAGVLDAKGKLHPVFRSTPSK